MKSKVATMVLAAALFSCQTAEYPAYAKDMINMQESLNEESLADIQKKEDKVFVMSLEKAVEIAMENNMDIKALEVDKKSAQLQREIAERAERKIRDGDKDLSDAREQLHSIESIAGAIPDGVTLGELSQDKRVKQLLEEHPELSGLDKKALEENVIEPAKDSIDSGSMKIDSGVQSINDSIKDKLDISTSAYLSMNSATDVLTTMAQLQDEVTSAGYEVAKKKVALLVRKNYYDAIKAQKMEMLKKVALERAKRQYEIAKASYEEGMRARDDLLLAKIQMNLFEVEFQKSQMERKNAYTELKKVVNTGFENDIRLVEDFQAEPDEVMDLESGIMQGLQKRIEIKKCAAQYVVDKMNYEMVAKGYPENTYQNKEAKAAMEKSAVELEKMQIEVESEIRQSYETFVSARNMISYTKGIEEDAQKALEIAQLRYEEGYGIESAALKSEGLSDFAGTIVEVTSAQERLAKVEETVVHIIFSYNMARDKYLTDIGTY
ncbi:Outer membrane efflux protein [Peptoclostridium litorale DSM 5388]|uniref:Outer membrane efflux protein n=1 Tax=Peptoclostridium litorale DSM 5388 TaxID=1121324 RepID=A0A069RKN0_PEPLI|nr:TolC family protein [Peptoclostridium litorale]KDR94792.1 outer membrane efflux protein [Peptoclostridium litorale DSM 5388]SIN92789.1 Outer membrane efflux protein [Peptoclostridium litorale DSM 5388]